jgi:acyl carrier protein
MSSPQNIGFEQIEAEIRGLIAEIIEVPPEQILGTSSFADDLGVDSLMALEIVASIEKKYRVQIPEAKLQQVKTLNDTIALARACISMQPAS